jgi:hypothetical protein
MKFFSFSVFKLVELTEKYIADLDSQDKLDLDTFKQLVSCIPKEERSSFDNLTQILLKKLDKGWVFFSSSLFFLLN